MLGHIYRGIMYSKGRSTADGAPRVATAIWAEGSYPTRAARLTGR